MNYKNSVYFSQNACNAGDFASLLNVLMNTSYSNGEYYNDIHIKPEGCGAFSMEWNQIPWPKTVADPDTQQADINIDADSIADGPVSNPETLNEKENAENVSC